MPDPPLTRHAYLVHKAAERLHRSLRKGRYEFALEDVERMEDELLSLRERLELELED